MGNAIKSQRGKLTIKSMALIAMLGALSGVLLAINFPLPIFPSFYKFDIADLPALLGAFYMGPLAGTLITVLKIVIGLLITSSSSLLVGDFSNLLNTLAFILPAALIYRHNRTKKSAVLGMAVATVFSSILAIFINAFIMLPLYSAAFGMPMESIIGMGTAINGSITSLFTFLVFAVLPFNLLKRGATSLVTFLIYKRIGNVLNRFMGDAAKPAPVDAGK